MKPDGIAIKAGEKNDPITVQKNNSVDNPDGQPVQDWDKKPFWECWSQIIPRGGSERKVFVQLRAEVSHLVRIDYCPESIQIKPANFRFLTIDGAVLNIESVIDIQSRRTTLEFRCTEVQQ